VLILNSNPPTAALASAPHANVQTIAPAVSAIAMAATAATPAALLDALAK